MPEFSTFVDSYRILNATILNKGEKKLRHFIAYYKDKLAAAGTLFLTDDAVMIHNVATATSFKVYCTTLVYNNKL